MIKRPMFAERVDSATPTRYMDSILHQRNDYSPLGHTLGQDSTKTDSLYLGSRLLGFVALH